MIRNVTLSDADTLANIYNRYIENSTTTFEEESIATDEMRQRIRNVTENYPWIVYEMEENVVGYTYATKWKERASYRHAVETAIYLDRDHHGKGIGTKLKGTIIDMLRDEGFHCVISGIAMPNPGSVELCKKFGFEKVAHFKQVGFKFNQWIDVAYWQLLL